MSLKENINFIKDEISTEERFFEGFFKLEKIWKKYKVAIISVAIISIAGFVGINIKNYLDIQNKIQANKAYNALLENKDDKKALEILKKSNPNLLEIAKYMQNKDLNINIEFLKEISIYNHAVDNGNLDEINKIILNQKFLIKEYAIFQKALIQALNSNYKDAKETLKLIPDSSSVSKLADQLKHFLLTK
jgi:hypothetical protein